MLVGVFIYIRTLRLRAAKAQVSRRICADSPEHSLLDTSINSKISCAVSILNLSHAMVPFSIALC